MLSLRLQGFTMLGSFMPWLPQHAHHQPAYAPLQPQWLREEPPGRVDCVDPEEQICDN